MVLDLDLGLNFISLLAPGHSRPYNFKPLTKVCDLRLLKKRLTSPHEMFCVARKYAVVITEVDNSSSLL
jgi:hypothetical protein